MRRHTVIALLLGLSVACGPPPISEECVPVDEHLGTVVHWCDGIFHPRTIPIWPGWRASAEPVRAASLLANPSERANLGRDVVVKSGCFGHWSSFI
jgi:hypothetical protein